MSDETANRESQSPRLALVTAGGRRLGRAIALRLAELGYDIALHYNSSADEASVTARQIESRGRQVQMFQRDFSHFDEVLTLMPDISESMGAPPNLLVNNASVYEENTLVETKPEDFDLNFNLHVKAPFFLTKDFAKYCVGDGLVVNMVDTSVLRYATKHFPYLLSKKALFELTKMSARELAPRVRVNAIAPGIVVPATGEERAHEKFAKSNPLHRAASAKDILVALEYLINNGQVTGECLFVDGGKTVDF